MNFRAIGHLGPKRYSFTRNGLTCRFDPHLESVSRVTTIDFKSPTGANVRLMFAPDSRTLYASVNGNHVWNGQDSGAIKDAQLRAMIEAGATAWAQESAAKSSR
jgi:hypothetical protein